MATAPHIERSELNNVAENEGVMRLTHEDARAYFDAQARRMLGMSGGEFPWRPDAGEFDDLIDGPEPIGHLEMLSAIVL